MATQDLPNFDFGDDLLQDLELVDFLDEFSAEELSSIDNWVASSTFNNKETQKMEEQLQETGRFKRLCPEQLNELERSRQAKATKSNTQWGIKLFQDWSIEANGDIVNFQTVTAVELNEHLRRFYAEAAPKHTKKRNDKMGAVGSEYHKNTMKNIRGAINRHLANINVDFDIVRDKRFKTSNNMLDAKLKTNLLKGLTVPTSHKAVISKEDLVKISTYLNRANQSPVLLRFKVWYDLAIHFVSRGLELHSQLSLRSFMFLFDEQNKEFVTLSHETREKTRQGGLDSDEGPADKRMYASSELASCPVHALKILLDKTDPNAKSLFNHCNKAAMQSPDTQSIWYTEKPVKMYQFSRFMADISKQANCSRHYTAHCLRATAIQTLSDAGFELRHIMYMSGHRNESSIRSYSRDCSTQQKEALSKSLSTIHNPNETLSLQCQTPPPETESVIAIPPPPVPASLSVQPSNVAVSQQISNRSHSNLVSAGLMSHSSFSNCTIRYKPIIDKFMILQHTCTCGLSPRFFPSALCCRLSSNVVRDCILSKHYSAIEKTCYL